MLQLIALDYGIDCEETFAFVANLIIFWGCYHVHAGKKKKKKKGFLASICIGSML
jgi:hypothetical protein